MNDELERLMREASPQPWYYPDDGGHLIYGQRGLSGVAGVFPGSRADPKPSRANAALICAAVNALPEMLAKVKRLEEALEKIADPATYSHNLLSCCQHTFDDTCELFSDIARAALNQETKQEDPGNG